MSIICSIKSQPQVYNKNMKTKLSINQTCSPSGYENENLIFKFNVSQKINNQTKLCIFSHV